MEMINNNAMLEYSIFGKQVNLEGFIRELLKEKIRTDPIAKASGFSEDMADGLTIEQLAGTPEASIAVNFLTWKAEQVKGVPNKVIAKHIDNHRALSFPITDLSKRPSNPDLISHIKFRAHIEKPEGAPINDEYIEKIIGLCQTGIIIDCPDDIKGSADEPSIPSKKLADDRLIRWIIYDDKDVKVFRGFYSENKNVFFEVNFKSIKQEIEEHQLYSASSLIDRARELSQYYDEHLYYLVIAQGGLRSCPTDFQAAMVLVLTKITVLLNFARLKYGVTVPEDILDMTRNQ